MNVPDRNFVLFTTGWKAYQAILDHDCLWHSMAERELNRALLEKFGTEKPFSFLDLACGDARSTSKVLAEFPNCHYTGVDSSHEALNKAKSFVSLIGNDARLVLSDYLEYLATTGQRFDCIYSGLVAHHLGFDRLHQLFDTVKKCLNPGGIFMAFESFHLSDESRDDHSARLCAMIRHFWIQLSEEYQQNIIDHVTQFDFPVSFQQWNDKAVASGLSPIEIKSVSPDRLLAFVAHH
ncbi:MAG: class I SAM-dependent methyltransferase [Isosphaeraceae bacterium]